MSKADAITFESPAYYASKLVIPGIGAYSYFSKSVDSEVKVYTSIHAIAASASNEAITLDEDDNTELTFLWDTSGVGNDALTIKTNSDTDARAVKPLRVISGKLTALTVSNSGASTNYLGIARIVPSDSTNIVLKKES